MSLQETSNRRAASLMVAAMATFCANDAVVKLVIARLPSGEAMALRGLFVVGLLSLALPRLGLRAGRPDRHTLLRAAAEAGVSFAFLAGLTLLPLADTYTLYFTAPLMLTTASALVLGEAVGSQRWLAVVAGFLGVLIVMGPPRNWAPAMLLPLLAASLSVVRDIATRRVPATVGSGTVALATGAAVSLGGLLTLPTGWLWPTPAEFGLSLLAAAGAAAGYVLIVLALRLGDLSFVAPFRYAGIPIAMLLQLLLWDEAPGGRMLLGASVILLAGLFIVLRERQLTRRLTTADVIGPA